MITKRNKSASVGRSFMTPIGYNAAMNRNAEVQAGTI